MRQASNYSISLGRNKFFVLGWLPQGAWGQEHGPLGAVSPPTCTGPLQAQGPSSQHALQSWNAGSCLSNEEIQIFPARRSPRSGPRSGRRSPSYRGTVWRRAVSGGATLGSGGPVTGPGRPSAPRAVYRHPPHPRRTRPGPNAGRTHAGNGHSSASCPTERR